MIRVEPDSGGCQLLAEERRQRAQGRAGRHRRSQEARDFKLPRHRLRDGARVDDEELQRSIKAVQEAARLAEGARV